MKNSIRLFCSFMVLVLCFSLSGCKKTEPEEAIAESDSIQSESDRPENTDSYKEQVSEKTVTSPKKNKKLDFENIPTPDRSDIRTSYSMLYKKNGTALCAYNFETEKEIVLTENFGDVEFSHPHFQPLTNLEGNIVVYTDNVNKKQKFAPLYVINLDDGKKQKICDNAIYSHLSDDGRYVNYVTYDNSIFVYDTESGKTEQVANGVTDFIFSRHGKTAFYIADNTLYVKNVGKKSVLVGQTEEGFIHYAENANVLYYKRTDGMVCGVDRHGNTYELAILQKEQHPHGLNSGEIFYYTGSSITGCPLYYFDGKKSVLLSERFVSIPLFSQYDDYYIFKELKDGITIDTNSEVFKNSPEKYTNQYLVLNGVKSELPSVYYKSFKVINNCSKIYYITNYDRNNTPHGHSPGELNAGDMYEITVKNNKAGEPKLYDTNVKDIIYADEYNSSDDIFYLKQKENISDRSGILYCNKQKILGESLCVGATYYKKANSVIALEGSEMEFHRALYKFNGEKATKLSDIADRVFAKKNGDLVFSDNPTGYHHAIEFVLNLYADGKVTQIAPVINSFKVLENDDVVFVGKQNEEDIQSSLFIYKDGTLTKLVDNVIRWTDTFDGYRARKYFIPEGAELSLHCFYY